MIVNELAALHEEAQVIVDAMERDGTREAYPADYANAVNRAEFYISAALNFERLKEQMGERMVD